jgi:hypothetical protein
MVANVLGTDLGGFLFGSVLFIVFVLVFSAPFLLVVWAVRRWYAAHRLRELPLRRRRALFGLALLWSGAFDRRPKWMKFAGLAAILSLLLAVFLVYLNDSLYSDSLESITIHDLRRARYIWLYDGCENPPDSKKYLGESSSWTNYAYTNTHQIDGRVYHGLFAMRANSETTNYVITTTDEILILEGSGQARLLKRRGEW